MKHDSPGLWTIGSALRMQVLNGPGGEPARDGINGVVRRNINAKSDENAGRLGASF